MRNLIALIAGAVLLASCNASYKKTKAGARFKIVESKGGKPIKLKEFVRMNQVIAIAERDTVLYTTHGKMPGYLGIDTSRSQGYVLYALSEVLMHCKVGDSVIVVISADTLAKRTNPQTGKTEFMYDDVLKRGGFLTWRLRVTKSYATFAEANTDIMADQLKDSERKMAERKVAEEKWLKEMQEKHKAEIATIETYLQKNNIKTVKTPSGAYVEVQQQGTGLPGQKGDKASFKYTGRFLGDGNTFDQGVYGALLGSGGVIKGMDEGLMFFAKGGKGRIFIPSFLGYGEEGSSERIPPNASLIFDIEITELQSQKSELPDQAGHTDH